MEHRGPITLVFVVIIIILFIIIIVVLRIVVILGRPSSSSGRMNEGNGSVPGQGRQPRQSDRRGRSRMRPTERSRRHRPHAHISRAR